MIRAFFALIVLMTASPAFACPNCALNSKAGLGSWFILGAMILFPFAVFGGSFYVVRKLRMGATEQENLG